LRTAGGEAPLWLLTFLDVAAQRAAGSASSADLLVSGSSLGHNRGSDPAI
jgi:hypothetical protein